MTECAYYHRVRASMLVPKLHYSELYIENKLVFQSKGCKLKADAIKALNDFILAFNREYEVKTPILLCNGSHLEGFFVSTIPYPKNKVKKTSKAETKPKASDPVDATAEATEKAAEQRSKQQAEPKKPATPKRKPFTPYGLNGYFVDKNSNIRLLLDRKANSKTITLNPDFFASLAEMVKKTQEYQHDAKCG